MAVEVLPLNVVAPQAHPTFRAALIGSGKQARDDHLPALLASEFAELVAVCDVDPEVVRELRTAHGVPGYTDHRALMADERLDFVIVAVPHHAGQEIIECAAGHGVHVLKEKPFATSVGEATTLTRTCADAGIELMVTLQRRFNPIYTTFCQLYDQIGRPFVIDAEYTIYTDNPADGWRGDTALAGGGCIIDMGYHVVDMLLWYFGLPDRVVADFSAGAHPELSYDAEDTATVLFGFDSGLFGSMRLSRCLAPKTERIRVAGTRGSVVLERGRIQRLRPDGEVIESLAREASWPSAATNQIDYFCRVLTGERPNPVQPRIPPMPCGVHPGVLPLAREGRVRRPQGVAPVTSPLAIHGGTPVIGRPAPHVPWPPIDDATAHAVLAQLRRAVSIPDRSGIVGELEDRLADYFGVRHAVLTNTGTAALHSAYAALAMVDSEEVIAPAYTFHATASPLFHLRVKPVLVDCDEQGNLDPAAAENAITPHTSAIAVTHMWGIPAQINRLAEITDQYGLALVEDGSHAHGATVSGRKIGSFGQVAAFSMNGPKPLSAGEGGFVVTDDEEIYYRVLLHGQYNARCRKEIPLEHPLWRYSVTGMGLKFRIHPLAAALALNQLDALDERLGGRRKTAQRMIGTLAELPGIAVPDIPTHDAPSWYALPLIYQPDQLDGLPQDAVVAALHAEGCLELDQPGSTRPVNEHPLFDNPHPLFPILPDGWPYYRPGQFPKAERLHRHTLKLTVPHDDEALADAYLLAFEKVFTNHRYLREDN